MVPLGGMIESVMVEQGKVGLLSPNPTITGSNILLSHLVPRHLLPLVVGGLVVQLRLSTTHGSIDCYRVSFFIS